MVRLVERVYVLLLFPGFVMQAVTALLAKTITKKLLTFATGREMGFSDRTEIERIVKATAKNDYRLRDIFEEIMNSKIFFS